MVNPSYLLKRLFLLWLAVSVILAGCGTRVTAPPSSSLSDDIVSDAAFQATVAALNKRGIQVGETITSKDGGAIIATDKEGLVIQVLKGEEGVDSVTTMQVNGENYILTNFGVVA